MRINELLKKTKKMNDLATLRLQVEIPSEKIISQVLLTVDEYKPLVQEALEEMKKELCNNEAMKKQIKEQLKQAFRNEMVEALKWQVVKVAKDLNYNEICEIEKAAEKIFNGMLLMKNTLG